MPGAARLGDLAQVQSDAHGCPACPHPGNGPIVSGSPDVNINSLPAGRQDDLGVHAPCCGSNTFTIAKGSSTVYVNGKPLARINDKTTHCGGSGSITAGSSDVMIDDGASAGALLSALAMVARQINQALAGALGAGRAEQLADQNAGTGRRGGGGDLAADAAQARGDQPGAGTGAGTGTGAGSGPGTGAGQPVGPGELDVQLVNPAGQARASLEVEVTLPSGERRAGPTDASGHFRQSDLPGSGNARLEIPDVQVAPAMPAAAQGRIRYVLPGVDVPIGQASIVEVPPLVRRARLHGLHFETAKTFLLPGAMVGIRQLVRLYKSFTGIVGLVNGHTDRQGSAEYNRGLSQERADSIKAFLTDDADAWMRWYRRMPSSDVWGVREDQYMLSTVRDSSGAPFLAGAVDGSLGTATRDAYRRFQSSRLITATGSPSDETRLELVRAYMALEGTSLDAGAQLQTHGCGFTHPVPETAGSSNPDQPLNRRVEVFLFEGQVAPPPRSPCPPAGCAEYQQWVDQKVLDVDLEAPPGSLLVKVLDQAGQPIPSAHVHASGPLPLDGATAADGTVRFDNLIPGAYRVIANKDGFSAADSSATVAPGPEGGAAADTTTGPPGSEVDLQLQAAQGDLHVTVRDPAGAAVAGAQVIVQHASSGASAGSGTTSASGEVDFPNLTAGSYSVGVSATGFSPQTVNQAVLPAQTNALQVTLQRATGTLRVSVVDSLGAVVSGASVSITPSTGSPPPAQASDGSGNASFAGVEVGAVQIAVTKAGFANGSGTATVAAGGTANATVTLTANTAPLTVHVTSSVGGANLAGASVALSGGTPGISTSATTDAQGLASFSALAPGSYSATISLADFTTATRTTTVQVNASNTLDVPLVPSVGNLEVHVVDNLGAAVPGASVAATPGSGTAPPAAPTDAAGRAGFTRVPVGAVSVQVSKPGFVTATGNGSVPPGAQGQINVTLQPAVLPVSVVVVSSAAGSPPLAGIAVAIAGPTSLSSVTGANGHADTNLLSGAYTITATAPDNFTAPGPVAFNVSPSQTNAVTVTLTPNPVTAQLTPAPLQVVLKKHGCNPARVPVTLRAVGTFTGSGTGRLRRSNANIKFFTAAGTELQFNGTDNVFTAAQLTAAAGVQLLAEGFAVSGAQQDITLDLELFVGANAFGTPASARATVIELTVDLFQSRTASAGDPAPMDANAKVDTGRFIHVQDPGNQQGRALVVVRPVRPAGFTQNLELRRLPPAGAGALQLFRAERPGAAPLPAVALPHPITPVDLAAAPQVGGSPGLAFFAEGQTVSGGLRDFVLQLGLPAAGAQAAEPDGDRAAFTVVQLSNLQAVVPSTPSPRTGPVPDHPPFQIPGAAAADFSEDFAVNRPLVLLQNSVDAAGPVRLSVTVAPAGVPVAWSALRDTRPAGAGAHANDGDPPAVVALSPNPVPTVAPTGATTATLLTDAVGSFRVRAFVNNNATPGFDRDPATAGSFAPDPFILLNLVVVHVRLDHDDAQIHQTLTAGPNGPGGIFASSGVFNVIAQPNNTALHHNALCTLIGGGRNGRVGTDRVFGGWMQDAVAAIGHSGTYVDATVAPPVNHPLPTLQENPRRGAFPANVTPDVLPSPPPPAAPIPPVAVFPTPPHILDSGRGGAGAGGLSGCLGQSRITNRNNLALGERLRIQAVDSPAMPYPGTHPGFPAARLTLFHFEMRFRAFLAFWTNNANPPNGNTSGDPAERLYVVALEVPWTMLGEWDVNPATGAITVHTAPVVAMPGNTPHTPAVAAAGAGAEPTVAAGQTTWLGTWIRDAQH